MESTQLSTWETLSPQQLLLEINLRLWLGFLNADWGFHQRAIPSSCTFPLEISYVRKLPPVYWPHFLHKLVSTVTERWLLLWWLSSKESACDPGDMGSIPGWGRSSGGGNGNPLKYSCLENPMERWGRVHGAAKSWTCLKWLSMHASTRGLKWTLPNQSFKKFIEYLFHEKNMRFMINVMPSLKT